MSLKELVSEIKSSLVPLTEKVKNRFDQFSLFVENANTEVSQWEDNTRQGVNLIHQVRDKQVSVYV